MNAGTAAGAIRTDISPTDMFAALAGIALTSARPKTTRVGVAPPRPHPGRIASGAAAGA
ncbi:hypothetical protein ACFTY8_00795 [Streptomyces mirabilis]|uniref:hypothetical protein n=1 Tax=Streptomyces mirabilis TaxID=68239 RepID=UPI0036441374